MSIPQETIELVRSRARIEEIITRYVPTLKKRGANYVGLCPFHKEKTPSFTVSPDKQIYHCFGCHSGGNVFSFVEKLEGLNFPQAVKFVGRIIGVDVVDEDFHRDTTVEEIYRINEYTAKVYQAFLKSVDGITGLDYLKNRGVTEEAIDEFRLGFAPESWDFLANRLKSVGADLSRAGLSGLLGSKESNPGRFYDRYRNRVIFPIIDQYGSVAGFGGRVIGEGEPKYLNSPESPAYKKRSMLYGYYQGKSEISSMKRAIIVEGYLDVIGCHQAGIRNVVAPLGTALTEEQVRLLARQCSEIVLLFDADSAGIKASIRSLEVVKDLSISVKVASLPEDDPFDFILKKGMREFMSIVDSALAPADYKIKRVLSVIRTDQMQTLLELFEVVRELQYDSERSEYLKKIASLTGYDQKIISADFQKFIQKGERPIMSVKPHDANVKKDDYLTRSYRDLIVLLMHNPGLLNKAVLDFSSEDFADSLHRNIFNRMCELYNEDENLSVDKLFDIFREGEEKRFLEENVSLSSLAKNQDDAYTEIYLNLRLYKIDLEIKSYEDLNNSNPSNDYLSVINSLAIKKNELKNYVYNMKKAP